MSARSRLTALAAAAAAVLLVALPTAPASAATRDGWVRLAHMSPDTAAVDVTLSSLSGDVVLFRLDDVAYGAISKYMRLPAGTYALAMRPAGSTDPDATPIVSGSVQVQAGEAGTVAAIGLNKDLETKAFSDDLPSRRGTRRRSGSSRRPSRTRRSASRPAAPPWRPTPPSGRSGSTWTCPLGRPG